MAYKFQKARRSNSQCLIGLYSPSGAGKTYGALLLMRGIVGPAGKIGMADSEGGRGQLFADVPEIGGYEYAEICEPFTPQAYIDAIAAAEQAGLDGLVIDSASHEWEGIGGVCHMAQKSEERSGKAGLHNWNKPKQEHQRFILKLLQTKLHVVVCLRGKRKSHQGKGKDGKTEIVKDAFYSAKMDEDFISEMLAYAEILGKDDKRGPKHSLIVGKTTHPAVATFFKTGAMITLKMGESFAQWSAGKIKAPDAAATEQHRQQERQTWEQQQKAAKAAESGDAGAPSAEAVEFVPPGGWPKLERLGAWGDWSKTFLATATKPAAEAWSVWWRQFWAVLEENAPKDKRAADLLAALKPPLNAAMKRP